MSRNRVKQGYVWDHIRILRTDCTPFELFLKIWDDPTLLNPHVPETAFPQNVCADGLIKKQLSALGHSNDRSHI